MTVPEKQLSLAIGKEGQNARLAARLTGWRVDVARATGSPRTPENGSNDNKVEASLSTVEAPAAPVEG